MKRFLLCVLGIVFLMFLPCACNAATSTITENSLPASNAIQQNAAVETKSEQSEPSAPRTKIYLSPTGSDENGDGSLEYPWQSVIKARDYIRTINQGLMEDIHVYFRGGTYNIDHEITFTIEDSGKEGVNIYYENYENEMPVLSGGKEVTGWILYDSANNIYQAKVDASDDFRQLYVNGKRAVLARTPNMTEEYTLGPYFLGGKWNYLNQYESVPAPYYFTVNSNTVPEWEDRNSPLELVTVDHWRLKMAHIASFENKGNKTIVQLKQPEDSNEIFSHANQYVGPVFSPYYFENSYNLLDAEGEWYFDKSDRFVYYKPRASENMSTAVIIVPNIETIISIKGIFEDTVSNLIFKGLAFEFSNWTLPSEHEYAASTAALDTYKSGGGKSLLPGAIELSSADSIRIENCTIRHTGAHAIVARENGGSSSGDSIVTNCVFNNNTIIDTSAGGIYLNLNDKGSTGNSITNNFISNGGRQYADAVGIVLARTPNAKVLHNEICFYGYAGIHVGWDWGDEITTARDIEVAYNKIHDVMQLLDDAGGIYTLGNIPGAVFHDNYIYNINRSPYQGSNMTLGFNPVVAIDNDGGSNKVFYNNVIENAEYTFSAINNPNHNNVFENNYYTGNIGFISSQNTETNNVRVNREWPEEAMNIIKIAGIEAD